MKTNRDKQNNLNNKNLYARKKIENYSYYLNEEIGRGYSSKVFKGKNDITIAIKVIDMKMLKSEIHKSLLISQIDCLKSLQNANNCLKLIQVYSTKNNTYLITQMCDQGDLSKWLNKKNLEYENFNREKQAVRIMKQIIHGYLCLHKKNIIHRDIKPTNIFIKQNTTKIADFGFAIKIKPNQQFKMSSYNVGSPLYMAPQALKDNKYSYKSDIWALGIVFFQLLTTTTPWKARSQKQLCKKIQKQPIKGLLPSKLSQKSKQFIIKCLDINVNSRMSPNQLEKWDFEIENIQVILQSKSTFDLNNSIRKQLKYNYHQKQNSITQNKQHDFSSPKNLSLKRHEQDGRSSKGYLTNSNKPYIFVDSLRECNSKQKMQSTQNSINILKSQIHLCRFVYKLINLMEENKDVEFEYKFFDLGLVFSKFIFLKFERLKEMGNLRINTFNLTNFQEFIDSQQFNCFKKVIFQYIKMYNPKYLKYTQKIFMAEPTLLFLKEQNNLIPLMEKLSQILVPIIKDFRDHLKMILPPSNNYNFQINDIGNKNKILLLDYLITYYQLIELSLRHPFDFQLFCLQSKIQTIVDAQPQKITTIHFQKIKQKIMLLSL